MLVSEVTKVTKEGARKQSNRRGQLAVRTVFSKEVRKAYRKQAKKRLTTARELPRKEAKTA